MSVMEMVGLVLSGMALFSFVAGIGWLAFRYIIEKIEE